MIKYDGMKIINKIPHLCMINDQNQKIEIPLEIQVAERITKYLSKIAPSSAPVERDDDLPLEDELSR